MTETLFREFPVRAGDGTGRTVHGIAVPYGQTVEISGYRERFQMGAFAKSIAQRGDKVKLFSVHSSSHKLPIGRATQLIERPDGLHAAFEIAQTRDGDEALELVRSGTVDSFSIGFTPLQHRRDGDVIVRTEAKLMEVSLVGIPAYDGASVLGVRSATPALSVDVARLRLDLILRNW